MAQRQIAAPPRPGTPAPDVVLPDHTGEPRRLSDLWAAAPSGTILVFFRHFGCLFCKEHAAHLRDTHQQFVDRGYRVVTIGQGTPQRAAKFQIDERLPFAVLADRERTAYAAYGLGGAPLTDLVKPSLIVAGMRAALRGARPGMVDKEGSASQLPGTFIVDNAGVIRYAKPAAHAGDLALPNELLAWIDGQSRNDPASRAAD